MGHPRPLFLYFRLSNTQLTANKCSIEINIFSPLTGFEPRTSGIGSDRSTNWATTTALDLMLSVPAAFTQLEYPNEDMVLFSLIIASYNALGRWNFSNKAFILKKSYLSFKNSLTVRILQQMKKLFLYPPPPLLQFLSAAPIGLWTFFALVLHLPLPTSIALCQQL